MTRMTLPLLFAGTMLLSTGAAAQTPEPLNRDALRRIMAAAEAEADRNGWRVVIAIVDPVGDLLMFHRMDNVQPASTEIAMGKARTAARFRRPTRALADAVAAGRTALLGVPGILAMEGGVPILRGGVVIGAIGVSGVTSAQDAQIAAAGAAAAGP